MYSGPLPHPNVLKAYKEIYPDSVKIIFEEYQKETNHRREMENKEAEINKEFVKESLKAEQRGYTYGLIIGIVALIVALKT